MKLNHINLVVINVLTAIDLFGKYFGFTCIETKGNNAVAVLKGADDFTLVLMSAKDNELVYPQAFHIGFMRETIEEVNEIHSKLKNAGFEVGPEPKKIRDSFGFYFTFENIMIEVGHYLALSEQ